MRMLFVYFVVVLFISGKSANPVESVDNVEASGETENANNDEDAKSINQSVIEQLKNEMPKEVEQVKRTKKSACAPCGGYSNQYDAQPSVAYSSPPISYGQQIAYAQPSYGGPPPGYGQPQYRPRYGGRKGNYRPAQPTYQSPQPTYQPPQPTYQPSPSYEQRPVYPATSYGAPSPSYSQPSYSSPSYGSQVSSAPVYPGPSKSYSYSSPSPTVPCSSNLLVGCHPHVSQVPCSGYSPSYESPAYGPPQQYSQPAYRSNSDEESAVASAQGPPQHSNEMTPNNGDNSQSKTKTTKENSVSSILNAPEGDGVAKNGANDKNENNGNMQKDIHMLATQLQTFNEEERKKIGAFFSQMNDEKSKQQNNAPFMSTQQNNSPSTQQTNEKQNKGTSTTTLPSPQPTSMNVGSNMFSQQAPISWQK